MTDLLLLMIVGKLFEIGNWYWIITGIISVFEFFNAIIKLGNVNNEHTK